MLFACAEKTHNALGSKINVWEKDKDMSIILIVKIEKDSDQRNSTLFKIVKWERRFLYSKGFSEGLHIKSSAIRNEVNSFDHFLTE